MKLSIHPLSDLPSKSNDQPLAGEGVFPIDAAAIGRLETSFSLLAGRGDELTKVFYDDLFTRVPAVRNLFSDDMASQRQKLLATLAWVVANLRKRDEMLAAVDALGKRHRGYGASAEHYPVVASCLMAAMRKVGGDAFTDDAAADWELAIRLLGERMIRAAESEA